MVVTCVLKMTGSWIGVCMILCIPSFLAMLCSICLGHHQRLLLHDSSLLVCNQEYLVHFSIFIIIGK